MKVLRLSLLFFSSLFSLCTPPARVEPFSYAEVQAQNPPGTPGVRYDGFVNTAATPVYGPKDALRCAEAECTLEYDTTQISFDASTRMWCVTFCQSDFPGGDQRVFLDCNGVTCLIVYGE